MSGRRRAVDEIFMPAIGQRAQLVRALVGAPRPARDERLPQFSAAPKLSADLHPIFIFKQFFFPHKPAVYSVPWDAGGFPQVFIEINQQRLVLPAPLDHYRMGERVPELSDRIAFLGIRNQKAYALRKNAKKILEISSALCLNQQMQVIANVGETVGRYAETIGSGVKMRLNFLAMGE